MALAPTYKSSSALGTDIEMRGIKRKGKLVFLLSLFALLNILDLYLTSVTIALGAQEMNPLFSHVNEVGITVFDVVGKVGCTSLICFVMLHAYKMALQMKSNPLAITIYVILTGLSIIGLIVVANNANCFLSLQK